MLNKIGKFLSLSFLVINLLLAAPLEFKASVDRKQVPLNQTLSLTLTIEGKLDVPGINLPDIKGFNVLGQSSSTKLQIINGNRFTAKVFSYTLSPTAKGKYTIPALTLEFGNQKYSSEPISVEVIDPVENTVQKTSRSFFDFEPFGNSKVIVKMIANKTNLFLGEKTKVHLQIYFQRPFYEGPVFDFPKMQGFLIKDLPISGQPTKANYQGENYNLITITREITPVDSGQFAIGEALVRYVDNAFAGIQTKKTNNLNLTVRSLPLPQPQDFCGAIGNFNISAKLLQQKNKYLQGESIALKVTLSGQGNLDSVNNLPLPAIPGFENYLDSISEDQQEDKIVKNFIYQLTAIQVSGEINLPQIKLVTFHPESKSYQTKTATLPNIFIEENKAAVAHLQNNQNISENALVIKLDKNLLAKIIQLSSNILLIFLSLAAILFLIIKIIQKIFSKKLLLKTKIKNLSKYEEKLFLSESEQLLAILVELKYQIKLSGVTQENIAVLINDKNIAQLIIDLTILFEQYKYIAGKQLTAADKSLIIKNLKSLINHY